MRDRVATEWGVPDGWQRKTIEELIVSIRTGTTPPSKVVEYYDGMIPWFTPGDIGRQKMLAASERTITQVAIQEKKARMFEAGTLLITCIGNIGRVGILGQTSSANQQVTGILCNHSIVQADFVYWWFRAVQKQLQEMTPAATIPILNQSNLKLLQVPIPSLDEQRRIVARVEELFARSEEAKRLRGSADEDVEKVMAAAMRETFTFHRGLPTGWQWSTVQDVGDPGRDPVQTGPFGAQLKSSEFVDTGVPVLAIGNVQEGYLDAADLRFVTPQKAERLSRYRVQPGDILFTRMGTVGRSCVVPPEAGNWLISYHLLRVAVDKSRCDPAYLSYCFRGAPQIEEQVELQSRGATRAGVNTTILNNLRFPLSPLHEQCHIVEYLDDVQAQVTELKGLQANSAAELDRLEQSILSRAFRGEL